MIGERVLVNGKAVDNVLVNTGEAATFNTMNQIDIHDFVGPYADYVLYFPMTYTDDLAGATITVRGYDCDVIGHPDHLRPKQVFGSWYGDWDMTVRAKKTLASKAEHIRLYAVKVSRDYLGNRQKQEITLFDGDAQARQDTAGENITDAGTRSREAYLFVLDWLPDLDEYQTQELFVDYRGKTFNVESVKDKDERNKTATLRGVWNG